MSASAGARGGRRQLGQILKELGVVREGQVQEALAVQRTDGGLLGQILIELKHCTKAVEINVYSPELVQLYKDPNFSLEDLSIISKEVLDHELRMFRVEAEKLTESHDFKLKRSPDGDGPDNYLNIELPPRAHFKLITLPSIRTLGCNYDMLHVQLPLGERELIL